MVRINLTEQELLDKIKNFKNPKPEDSNVIATVTYSKELDGKYFYGNIDKISKKEVAYRNIVEEMKYSLVICVDSCETGLFSFYNDFFDFFIADGRNGYFNRNIQFGKNVSAIFMQVPFHGYKVIVNENCAYKLNQQNLTAIKGICD